MIYTKLVLLLWFISFYININGQKEPANFYIDTRSTGQNPVADINNFEFRNNIPLKFIVHGWTENANKTHYINMAQVFLRSIDCYVIRVDYSTLAAQNYFFSTMSIREVGKYVGDYLVKIKRQFGIPLSNIHIIGHSLGGQVSGHVGRRVIEVTGERVHRITALDPAAPLFEHNPEWMKLTRKDAEIVDIIHTDGGAAGYAQPLGHVDFYPNGGRRQQPGCEYSEASNSYTPVHNFINDFCSHQKSFTYFTASILNNYPATKCDSWEKFRNGLCDQNERVAFGAWMPENATGTYFLEIDIDNEYIENVLLASQ